MAIAVTAGSNFDVRKSLPGTTKAAVLLLLLGEGPTAKIFKNLTDQEVTTLSRQITQLGRVDAEVGEKLLAHTHSLLLKGENIQGGGEYARKVLEEAFSPELARRVMKEILGTAHSDLESIKILKEARPSQLAKLLQSEHPQVVALVISNLNPDQAAGAISELPEDIRANICMRLARLETVPQKTRDRVLKSVASRLGEGPQLEIELSGGVRRLAEIFNKMDRETSKASLESIETENPNLAMAIRNNMFVFDDIILLADVDMRKIIQNVDKQLLTKALRGTHEELREHFFKNMSERASEILKEDMEALGPMKVREVEASQQEVVNLVRQLEAEGEVEIGDGGSDDYVD